MTLNADLSGLLPSRMFSNAFKSVMCEPESGSRAFWAGFKFELESWKVGIRLNPDSIKKGIGLGFDSRFEISSSDDTPTDSACLLPIYLDRNSLNVFFAVGCYDKGGKQCAQYKQYCGNKYAQVSFGGPMGTMDELCPVTCGTCDGGSSGTSTGGTGGTSTGGTGGTSTGGTGGTSTGGTGGMEYME